MTLVLVEVPGFLREDTLLLVAECACFTVGEGTRSLWTKRGAGGRKAWVLLAGIGKE